jgi:hypothetical protein
MLISAGGNGFTEALIPSGNFATSPDHHQGPLELKRKTHKFVSHRQGQRGRYKLWVIEIENLSVQHFLHFSLRGLHLFVASDTVSHQVLINFSTVADVEANVCVNQVRAFLSKLELYKADADSQSGIGV